LCIGPHIWVGVLFPEKQVKAKILQTTMVPVDVVNCLLD